MAGRGVGHTAEISVFLPWTNQLGAEVLDKKRNFFDNFC
jgi:hypothetical protein